MGCGTDMSYIDVTIARKHRIGEQQRIPSTLSGKLGLDSEVERLVVFD